MIQTPAPGVPAESDRLTDPLTPDERAAVERVRPWAEWLDWLDSDEGVSHRKSNGGDGTEGDLLGTIPNPPGKAIITVGDVRALSWFPATIDRLEKRLAEVEEDRRRQDESTIKRSITGDGEHRRYESVVEMLADQSRREIIDLESQLAARAAGPVPEDIKEAAEKVFTANYGCACGDVRLLARFVLSLSPPEAGRG